MVYMHFPAHMTDEEEMLMKKYAKLKKKKKILQSIRAQQRQDPKKEEETPKKRSSEEAANATEQAKKLLKAGAIKVGSEKKESQGFKKSKRQKDSEKSSVVYQPYSQESDKEKVAAENTLFKSRSDSSEERSEGGHSRRKDLYDSFIRGTEKLPPEERGPRRDRSREDREGFRDRERGRDRRSRHRSENPPEKGHTVYIEGVGLQEDEVRRAFSKVGNIVNISMEKDKNCGFVTFDKTESADEAIAQMEGTMVGDVQMHVSMARRQPNYEQTVDPSSTAWASAANSTQQENHEEKRMLQVYEDIF